MNRRLRLENKKSEVVKAAPREIKIETSAWHRSRAGYRNSKNFGPSLRTKIPELS